MADDAQRQYDRLLESIRRGEQVDQHELRRVLLAVGKSERDIARDIKDGDMILR